jgi:UDP-N-acetylmuramoyl-L-alanyl-D-glutamate--2,6-diaminopimelate ligase
LFHFSFVWLWKLGFRALCAWDFSVMRLSTLLAALPHVRTQSVEADPDITSLTADSRRVTPGALFIAARGENFDGHGFIQHAIEKGASAVVAERNMEELEGAQKTPLSSRSSSIPYIFVSNAREALAWLATTWSGFPSRRLVLIGVTGTDGKTTTSTLIHSILTAAGLKAGLISTVSAIIGDETLDTGFHVTTPDALAVQGYLARMVAAWLTQCVLEVTSHGLAQHRVTGCDFDVAVITNITHEHLDYHGTFENYRAAKAKLFENLAKSVSKPGGPAKAAVLNLDDSSYAYLSSITSVPRYRYSLKPGADVWAEDIRYAPEGLHFRAVGQGFEMPMKTTLVGEYNLSNCLAAITATVSALGLSPESARQGIAALKGVPGRMERIDLGQPFTAIVDFAHTPNALRRALETARLMAGKALTAENAESAERKKEREQEEISANSAVKNNARVIAVFGSAGLRDVEKRRLMAEVSAELADITVLTAEDPRTESLDAILEMMAEGARAKGGVEETSFYRVPDRAEAIRFAVRLAQPGDIVLACGKGHEQSMCFGTTEYSWDDRVAVRAALAELLSVPGPEMPKLPTAKG